MSDERPFLKKSFAGIVDDALGSLRAGRGGRAILDDATEGSVLRTLVETFARELAVCYEQLEAVYRAGYLDTAEGPALDKVVELIGVARHQAGWLEGDVVFGRATPAPFDIDVPAGTLVAGKRVQAFETLIPARLAQGQSELRVPVRSLVPEGDPVDPGALSILHRPIPGIERVTNPAALLPRREAESDADLRARARGAIRGGRTATVSALERAVLALGIVEVEVAEDPARPGRVELVLADVNLSDDAVEEARRRIEEVRPVGVRVDVYQATPVWIRVRAVVQLDAVLTPQAEAELRAALEADIRRLFRDLRVNDSVRWNKVRNLLAAHPRVAEVALPGGDWPLRPVDEQGKPLAEDEGGPRRLLGSMDAPIGVFIGAGERARLHPAGIELALQPPVLPVWIDVEGALLAGAEPAAAAQAVKDALAHLLPPDALSAPLTVSWDLLSARMAAGIAGLVAVDSLRFVIVHDKDGRVVTLADDPAASEEAVLTVREAISVRSVRLRAAEES